MKLYSDVNMNGELDNDDVLRDTENNYTGGSVTLTKDMGGEFYFLTVDAQGDCYDQVVYLQCQVGIILPVSLKSFSVRRSGSNVVLNWETSTEINNRGFYIQRRIGNNGWETLSFIPSQSVDGNSNALLSYSFTDINTSRGITQYRLRQVDHDNKSRYSDIRTIRGNGNVTKTIVYPNPSHDGTVNVVFEDLNASRDIMVSDLNGRVIKQWRNVTNNNLIIDNLMPGLYMIRIVDRETGDQVNEKLVVNRR